MIKKYMTKPQPLEVVQLTEHNLEEVKEFLGKSFKGGYVDKEGWGCVSFFPNELCELDCCSVGDFIAKHHYAIAYSYEYTFELYTQQGIDKLLDEVKDDDSNG